MFVGKERRIQKRLIQDCIAKHSACQTSDSTSFLPSRLIDVRAYPDVRLILQNEISANGQKDQRYVALSYCWGTRMPETGKATTDKLETLRKGIELSQLPATPRDAIKLTNLLGIPFLWVDSLCILQDDKQDWAREASLMSKVYSRAYITIAAGASDHCDGRFIKASYSEKDLPVPRRGGYGMEWDFTTPAEEPNPWIRSFFRNPLFSRGWVLQERELSPRILYFTTTHVVWECREEVCSYIRPLNRLSSLKIKYLDLDHFSSAWPFRCFDVPSDGKGFAMVRSGRAWPEKATLVRFKTWQSMIEDYSRRRLTVPTDKLPAIDGLAMEVQKLLQCDYLAGLWRGNLMRDLLWEKAGPEVMHAALDSSVYYAPSWSWALTNFPIIFRHDADDDDAEILDAGVTKSETGDGLVSGFIRMRARVLEVPKSHSICFTPDNIEKEPREICTVCILRTREMREEQWGGREGQQLVQGYRPAGGRGLMLEAAKGSDSEYRRVGTVAWVPIEMLEGVEYQEFSII
ncbi:hypothetical protein NW755_009952 [Fusarium falciforme]|uniref:Heterokaryon incompatibility domain-containing protein n=1 Tax=Fusarium falciforme TaxID=195108 RepID=A0A9W8UWB3_9HYPO|nr:hypothetical protein NW755_009952 [Fusarium falciforme]